MELGHQKVRHLRVLLFLVAKISCVQLSIGAALSLLRQPHGANCDCQKIGDDHGNASWPNVVDGLGGRSKGANILGGGEEEGDMGDEIHIGFLAGYVHSKVILGALLLAIETINNDSSLLPGKVIKLNPVDIGAQKSPKAYPIRVMTKMRDEGIHAFIGPDETCTTEALVASAWNLPMISYKCADAAVSDKSIYSSFARTLPPATKVSKSVVSLLLAYNWHCFSVVAGKHPAWSMEIAQAIKIQAESNNLTINHFREYSDYIPSKIYKLQNIVDDTYQTTRIYVFVGDYIEMVDFVRCMQNRKLLSSGDYMVISIDDEGYDPNTNRNIYQEYSDFYQKYIGNSKEPNKKRLSFKDVQERLQVAFQSVLRIMPLFPLNPQYQVLCHQIKRYAQREPFRVPLPSNERIFRQIKVPIYAAHLYDAVLIYARAATEVLREGGNLRNGTEIMRHIFNRSYHSIQGFDVYIDGNGDAEGNFSIIALQKDEKADNSLNKSMQPVGMFTYGSPSNGTQLPEFKYLGASRTIMWVKGRPPLAEPPCGFYGEKCRPRTRDWRFISGISMTALFVIIFAVILFK